MRAEEQMEREEVGSVSVRQWIAIEGEREEAIWWPRWVQ